MEAMASLTLVEDYGGHFRVTAMLFGSSDVFVPDGLFIPGHGHRRVTEFAASGRVASFVILDSEGIDDRLLEGRVVVLANPARIAA